MKLRAVFVFPPSLHAEYPTMWHTFLTGALILAWSSTLAAQDATKTTTTEKTVEKSNVEKLKENPNDDKALSAYINESMGSVMESMEDEPEAALKKLNEMAAFVGELKADSP